MRIFSLRTRRFGIIILIALALVFYFFLGRTTKSNVTDQALKQEQTIARAQASNITSFFQNFGNSVAVLANLNSMQERDESTQEDLDAFVEQWSESGVIGGVVLTDEDGVAIFNSNILGTHDIGASLADREYFSWAKNQLGGGRYYVSMAVVSRLGGSEGQIIVVVTSPVFRNGEFYGLVAASVEIAPLTERFLKLLMISGVTDVYLIGSDGDYLYNVAEPDSLGENVFESSKSLFLGSEEFTKELKSALAGGREGNGQFGDHLVAYSPVALGDRNWLVVMADPVQKVTNMTRPIYIRQISILLLIYLSIIILAGYIVWEANIQKTIPPPPKKPLEKP